MKYSTAGREKTKKKDFRRLAKLDLMGYDTCSFKIIKEISQIIEQINEFQIGRESKR